MGTSASLPLGRQGGQKQAVEGCTGFSLLVICALPPAFAEEKSPLRRQSLLQTPPTLTARSKSTLGRVPSAPGAEAPAPPEP